MKKVHDSHQSGHAPASDSQVLHAFVNGVAKHSTVGAWTEARNLELPNGWDRTKGETCIFWQKRTWHCHASDIIEIATPRWKRGTAHRTSFELHWALLENLNTGGLLLRAAGHHPSRLYTPSHARANDVILRDLPGELHKLLHTHHPDAFAYSADWNMDLRKKSKLHRAEKVARQIRSDMQVHVPPAATIGRRRRIDAVITDSTALLEMIPRHRGLDHQGFSIVH